MSDRSAASVVADMVDAAEQVDDYLTGVIGLAEGRLGGRPVGAAGRLGRRLSGLTSLVGFRDDHLARGYAGAYGPDQLRKAAVEADRLASLLDELRAIAGTPDACDPGGRVPRLVERLDEVGAAGIAGDLDTLGTSSPDLRAIHGRLGSARSELVTARAHLLLDRRRATTSPPTEADR